MRLTRIFILVLFAACMTSASPPATVGENVHPICSVCIYARDGEVTAGWNSCIVIEIQNADVHQLQIRAPVQMRAVHGVKENDNLPDRDPLPDDDGSLSIEATSYLSANSKRFAIASVEFPPSFIVDTGKTLFFKVEIPAKLIDLGINRLRVSIFQGGKDIAKSNVLVIRGMKR